MEDTRLDLGRLPHIGSSIDAVDLPGDGPADHLEALALDGVGVRLRDPAARRKEEVHAQQLAACGSCSVAEDDPTPHGRVLDHLSWFRHFWTSPTGGVGTARAARSLPTATTRSGHHCAAASGRSARTRRTRSARAALGGAHAADGPKRE